jgi:2-dehydro-3-deoxygluconokinase
MCRRGQKPFGGGRKESMTLGPGIFDVLTFGETMIVLIPSEPGPMELSTDFKPSLAGSESNCAVGLARLQHSVCWISRLGNDPFGKKILKTLRGESINVDRVEIADSAFTGLMFKEIKPTGAPQAYYYRRDSAASQLHPKLFTGLRSRYLFVTGITPALSSENRKVTFQIVEEFRAAGTKIVFDPNMRFKLWSAQAARPVFLELASKSDVLLPSLDEARLMTGLDKLDQIAEALLQLGPKLVAIKAGDQGAYFADGASCGLIPPFPVRQIDPIGAGDAFCAGVISGLLNGLPFQKAVERGCATGAICVTAYGDCAGLPDRTELEDFLAGTKAPGR